MAPTRTAFGFGQGPTAELFPRQLQDAQGDTGYRNADVIAIRDDLPGLDEALAKFDRLHYHDDNEVRAIVGGEGVFGFMFDDDRQFLLKIEAGEYIDVPAKTWHWFYCTESRNTALRLFEDMMAGFLTTAQMKRSA